MFKDSMDNLTEKTIGCALKVHRNLSAGFLESVYPAALAYEFSQANLSFEKEKELAVQYEKVKLDVGFRCDFMMEEKVIIECKAVEKITPIDQAQLLNYLKITESTVGLLINFNKACFNRRNYSALSKL